MSLAAPDRARADAARAALVAGTLTPRAFREALACVPANARDVWVDRVLGIDTTPEDASDLPRGCAPYLPCSIDALASALDAAEVGPDDVFVDVGSGLGRAAIVAHLATGASAIGIEIQQHLVSAARALARSLGLPRVTTLHGDVSDLADHLPAGTVFFLYCPFSGVRLEATLDDLEPIARSKTIRICTVDVPVPARDWLVPMPPPGPGVELFRSVRPEDPPRQPAVPAGNARR